MEKKRGSKGHFFFKLLWWQEIYKAWRNFLITTISLEQGFDFIPSHLRPIWPQTISTKTLENQYTTVYSTEEALARYTSHVSYFMYSHYYPVFHYWIIRFRGSMCLVCAYITIQFTTASWSIYSFRHVTQTLKCSWSYIALVATFSSAIQLHIIRSCKCCHQLEEGNDDDVLHRRISVSDSR